MYFSIKNGSLKAYFYFFCLFLMKNVYLCNVTALHKSVIDALFLGCLKIGNIQGNCFERFLT